MRENRARYYIAIVLIVVLFAFFVGRANANKSRVLEISPSGPYGGDIWALAFSPDYSGALQQGYILAGVSGDARVYRLNADENGWYTFAQELPSSYNDLTNLVITPDHQIYLTVFNEGIYKIGDDGMTWVLTHNSPRKVTDVARHAEGELYVSAYGGVYREQEASWERLTSTGLLNTDARVLEITPDKEIWVGVYSLEYEDETGGVYRLSENSSTWEHLNQGDAPTSIVDLAITESGDVWAIGSKALAPSVFYLPANSLKWEIIDLGHTIYGTSIAVDSHSESVWIGTASGLLRYISEDGIWQSLDTGLLGRRVRAVQDIVFAPDGTPWIATASGIYILPEAQTIWHPLMQGITELRMNHLSVDQDGVVWAAGSGNIFRSNSKNSSWDDMSYALPTAYRYNYDISAITIDKNGEPWIATYQEGIFRLPSEATRWQKVVNDGLTVHTFGALLVDSNGGLWTGESTRFHINSLFYLAPEASTWLTMNEILTTTAIVTLDTAPTGEIWVGGHNKIARISIDSTLLLWDIIEAGWPDSSVIDMEVTETGDVWVSLFSLETQTNELYYLLAGNTTWERDSSAMGTIWLTASKNGDLWAVRRKDSKWELFYLPIGEFVWQKLDWESNRDIESLAVSYGCSYSQLPTGTQTSDKSISWEWSWLCTF